MANESTPSPLAIYDYVLKEKEVYESGIGVPIAGSWQWSMYTHCVYTLLMKNGQFPITQTKLGDRPKKNIILPILNVAHRSEDFDVKDIEIYVDDPKNYHYSTLARKFYYRWAIKHGLDTFIDDIVEAFDYGFCLVKDINDSRPEVIEPQQIAFVDQTDILSGTICLKHSYSIDQLKSMVDDHGWYKDEVDMAILDARTEKDNSQAPGLAADTPDKHIEVFEVHGTFPDTWLSKGEDEYDSNLDPEKYTKQIHIITYLKGATRSSKHGICLFKGIENESIFKVKVLNKIYGRAAGRGRVEELFEPQIWVDNNMIRMQKMLEEASKVWYQTADDQFTTRNNTKNIRGGEVMVYEDGKPVTPVNTQPINFNLFDRAVSEWEQHARTTGSASDPSLGLNPVSGTPLGTTQIVTSQGLGIHEYNRGKIAEFVEEIHRDFIIKHLVDEMNKGDQWLDELSLEELQDLAENISIKESNKRIKDAVLNGGIDTVNKDAQDLLRQVIKEEFTKGGKKQFMEIMKGEFAKLPLNLRIVVANKQKDLGKMADKMSNIFRAIFADPAGFAQAMQIPAAAKAFSEMIEYSGLSPFDYSQIPQIEQPTPSPMQATPEPLTSNQ